MSTQLRIAEGQQTYKRFACAAAVMSLHLSAMGNMHANRSWPSAVLVLMLAMLISTGALQSRMVSRPTSTECLRIAIAAAMFLFLA